MVVILAFAITTSAGIGCHFVSEIIRARQSLGMTDAGQLEY